MGRNSASETDSSDTDARIKTQPPAADPPNGTTTTVPPSLADTSNAGWLRFFDGEADGVGDHLGGLVADITTVAQARCEHCANYADVEVLVYDLPIDHLTFDAHDSFAPYSGPYPLVIHIQASLLKEINGWDETALHDHLRTHPSLRQNLGLESLPNQSTFWRTWNERFSEALRDAIQECADAIVRGARACKVSLPDRIGSDEADESKDDTPPEHQFDAEENQRDLYPLGVPVRAVRRGGYVRIINVLFSKISTHPR